MDKNNLLKTILVYVFISIVNLHLISINKLINYQIFLLKINPLINQFRMIILIQIKNELKCFRIFLFQMFEKYF